MDIYPTARRYVGERVVVLIDRPLGSRHPEHGFVYEVNYGYVPGTLAPDGEPLDAYVLGVDEPVQEFAGDCIAYVHRLDDEDDKLVVVPHGREYTDEEILERVRFQEQFFRPVVIR